MNSAPHNLASDSSTSSQILSRWIITYLHLAPLLAQTALRPLSREFDKPRQMPTAHGTRCLSLPPDATPTRLPLASPVAIAASRPLSMANLSLMHNLGRCLFLSSLLFTSAIIVQGVHCHSSASKGHPSSKQSMMTRNAAILRHWTHAALYP